MNKILVCGGVLIAIVIATGFFLTHQNRSFGAALPTDGTVTRVLGVLYSYTNGLNGIVPGIWSDGVVAVGTYLQFNAGTVSTSAATSTSLIETASVGACATGTSTPFGVLNPLGATSTASITIVGVGNATSTNLTVGTSTQATGQSSTSVSANLISAATIGTSSPQFTIVGGVVNGADVSAGSNTSVKIVVGPSQYLSAYATSTYGNAGALNYSAALASCTYRIKWSN